MVCLLCNIISQTHTFLKHNDFVFDYYCMKYVKVLIGIWLLKIFYVTFGNHLIFN